MGRWTTVCVTREFHEKLSELRRFPESLQDALIRLTGYKIKLTGKFKEEEKEEVHFGN